MKYVTLDYLNEISGGDKEFQQELISTFLSEMGEELNLLSNSAKTQDWKTLGNIAHKIKAPVGMFCIEDVKDKILFIEKSSKNMQSLELLPAKVDEFISIMQVVIDEISNV
jgi:HPt (histidine-containing phosphotransfer) domain-containing protein